jgi:hypothetical protein
MGLPFSSLYYLTKAGKIIPIWIGESESVNECEGECEQAAQSSCHLSLDCTRARVTRPSKFERSQPRSIFLIQFSVS